MKNETELRDRGKRSLAAVGITLAVFAITTGLFIIGSRIVWGEWPW